MWPPSLRSVSERRHLLAEPLSRRLPVDRCCRAWLGLNAWIALQDFVAPGRSRAAMTRIGDGSPPNRSPAAAVDLDNSLDALFRKEEPGLHRYFRRRLRNDDDALDCVQEAFARLLSAIRGGTPAQPAAYLRRIAVNLLIDRTKSPRTVYCNLSFEISTPAEQEDGLLAEDAMEIYQSVLDSLPERTRAVFLLYRVEELKYREIAEQMSISIPAVQKHMARALERLTLALNGAA